MSSVEFGWESMLHTDAPDGCVLKAALFTTYDRPDERLLVEHLLPFLLRLNREADGEGAERQYFLLELDRRLKQLHDQIVVVSSMAREEPEDREEAESGTYGWIWRSIRHLTVGSRGRAVQHAKLWMLHWSAVNSDGVEYLEQQHRKKRFEYLELVVSSANLTRAALRGQLQAAWRVCIELRQHPSAQRAARWGVLPDFLRELAASAGKDRLLERFVELLARAECPEGISFIASVPGKHSRHRLRRTPWGAAGLRKVMPVGRGRGGASILSPFIGSWSKDSLRCWCRECEAPPERIELVWIDKDHPWARTGRWLLPTATLKTLEEAGVALLHFRHEPDDDEGTDLFHNEHRPQDDRWSHAKVYVFKRGASRRLLVTSANFSPAAWGKETPDGELVIENFELGVCLERATWPFSGLEIFEDLKNVATVSSLPSRGSALIGWAQAVWDGKKVMVYCRCEADQPVAGQLNAGGKWTAIKRWTATNGRRRSGHVAWTDANRLPCLVQLTCGGETVNVKVFDERPLRGREDSFPPEVDINLLQAMRDELLFEEYGGRAAVEPGDEERVSTGAPETADTPASMDEDEQEGGGHLDDYSVPTFVLARRHFEVIKSWSNRVRLATKHDGGQFERDVLRRDGELLIGAFQRQASRDDKRGPGRAIGAVLAAEELALRLRHFPGS